MKIKWARIIPAGLVATLALDLSANDVPINETERRLSA